MKSKRVRRLAFKARASFFGGAAVPDSLPRMIFTITNGRSGSNYLQALFEHVEGVHSQHEADPRFDALMHDVQSNPALADKFWRAIKLPAIAQCPEAIYLETSHMFGKGFFEPLLTMRAPFDLISMGREPRAIARSMWRLDSIPGRTKRGKQFWLNPDDNVLAPLPGWREMSDYQLCYWHVLEMEKRRKTYAAQARAAGLRVFETSLEALNSFDEVENMCAELQVPLTDVSRARLSEFIGAKVNHRGHVAGPQADDEDLYVQEHAVKEAVAQGVAA